MRAFHSDFADMKRQSHSLSATTRFRQMKFMLDRPGLSLSGAAVDEDRFSTLEVAHKIGSAISAADNEPENEGVVVISQFVWQQLFGADPAILDKYLQLSGKTYRVIGVMAGGFNYPRKTELDEGDSHIDATDVWVPLALTAKQRANRGLSGDSYALGRLKQGVSTRQTEAEISLDSTQSEKRSWRTTPPSFLKLPAIRESLWALSQTCAIGVWNRRLSRNSFFLCEVRATPMSSFTLFLPRKDVLQPAISVFYRIDPSLAFSKVHSMREMVSDASALRRFQTVLLSIFAAMATTLALIGFNGLLTYTASRRGPEMGIRIALGATRSDILRLFLGQGLRIVALGLVLGLGAAFALTRFLSSTLYEVRTWDPATLAVVPTLFLIAALAASLVPAQSCPRPTCGQLRSYDHSSS